MLVSQSYYLATVGSEARRGALLLDHDLRRLHQAPQHASARIFRFLGLHHHAYPALQLGLAHRWLLVFEILAKCNLRQIATGIGVLNRPSRLRKFSRIWLSHHRGGYGGVSWGPWSGTPSGQRFRVSHAPILLIARVKSVSRFSSILSRCHPWGSLGGEARWRC